MSACLDVHTPAKGGQGHSPAYPPACFRFHGGGVRRRVPEGRIWPAERTKAFFLPLYPAAPPLPLLCLRVYAAGTKLSLCFAPLRALPEDKIGDPIKLEGSRLDVGAGAYLRLQCPDALWKRMLVLLWMWIRHVRRVAGHCAGAGDATAHIIYMPHVSKTCSWWEDRRTPFSDAFHVHPRVDRHLPRHCRHTLHTSLDIVLERPYLPEGGGLPTKVKDATTVQTIVGGSVGGRRLIGLIMNVAVWGERVIPGNTPWLNQAGNPMQDFINNKAQ
ncbi:hypothetical protein C8R45DRAFT_1101945 [Mycena sanguinolenta]|nr:hypothetical protein C8R45DRAFT_1101945 [Mycena sanguinolenta]